MRRVLRVLRVVLRLGLRLGSLVLLPLVLLPLLLLPGRHVLLLLLPLALLPGPHFLLVRLGNREGRRRRGWLWRTGPPQRAVARGASSAPPASRPAGHGFAARRGPRHGPHRGRAGRPPTA